MSDHCDLCEAARITPWFHEDDLCWIAECEICAVPMVVWREHDPDPPERPLGPLDAIRCRLRWHVLRSEPTPENAPL